MPEKRSADATPPANALSPTDAAAVFVWGTESSGENGNGNIPQNGIFGWAFARRMAGISDGLSNTLAMGEFVQIDEKAGSGEGSFEQPPGNVRPWIFGAISDDSKAMYAAKVAVYAINTSIDRVADGVPFNHLPAGSFHPAGAHFLIADGSVRFLADTMDFREYQALCTCNGGLE